MASGASYVVIYEADVELRDGVGVTVEIRSVEPPGSDSTLVELARQSIALGAEQVLDPVSMGASISVRSLVIQGSDFHPRRFSFFTARGMEKLLEGPSD
jgi:hypothetical protein